MDSFYLGSKITYVCQSNSEYEKVVHLVKRVETSFADVIHSLESSADEINALNRTAMFQRGFGLLVGFAGWVLYIIQFIAVTVFYHLEANHITIAQVTGMPIGPVILVVLLGLTIVFVTDLLLDKKIHMKIEYKVNPLIKQLGDSIAELNTVWTRNAVDISRIQIVQYQSETRNWLVDITTSIEATHDVGWVKSMDKVLRSIISTVFAITFATMTPLQFSFTFKDCINNKRHGTADQITERVIPTLKEQLASLTIRANWLKRNVKILNLRIHV